MAAIATISTGQELRDYSDHLRRYSDELVNAAKAARHRAKIAVDCSRRARDGRNAAAAQLERESVTY